MEMFLCSCIKMWKSVKCTGDGFFRRAPLVSGSQVGKEVTQTLQTPRPSSL